VFWLAFQGEAGAGDAGYQVLFEYFTFMSFKAQAIYWS